MTPGCIKPAFYRMGCVGMGEVLLHPGHARSLGLTGSASKSSAVTNPPLSSFNFLMVDQSGRTVRRRIRLMVTRDKPVTAATSSSESFLSNMNFERCAMPDLYAGRTMRVKANCTPSVLYEAKLHVHDTYMPTKKGKARAKRPKYQRTFIKQWRDYRDGMTQEQLAERVTNYMVEHGTGAGYTHASIGRLERGLMPYSQPVLEALAHSLGTDPASLLIRDPNDQAGIWTLWEEALPDQRETITEHAEVVLRKKQSPSPR